jgi:hypothetical protein
MVESPVSVIVLPSSANELALFRFTVIVPAKAGTATAKDTASQINWCRIFTPFAGVAAGKTFFPAALPRRLGVNAYLKGPVSEARKNR